MRQESIDQLVLVFISLILISLVLVLSASFDHMNNLEHNINKSLGVSHDSNK